MASSDIRVGPRSTSLGPAGVLDSVVDEAQEGSASSSSQGSGRFYNNVLSEYASYSCLITFGVLTDREVNDPANTYRQNGPERIIAKSAGSDSRQVPTLYEQELGITAEYFIDNLEITSVLVPTGQTRQTNSNIMTFSIKEPYSMGLLLETLAATAQDAYPDRAPDGNFTVSYIDVPYLLMIEFVGWNDDGEYVKIPNTTRFIPMRLTNLDFTVDAGGAAYNCRGVVWNEIALLDEVQRVEQDIQIEGTTVAEFLQSSEDNDRSSLTSILNQVEESEKQAQNKPQPDQYIIAFPKDGAALSAEIRQTESTNQGATTPGNDPAQTTVSSDTDVTLDQIKDIVTNPQNINEIGQAKLSKSAFDAGSKFMGIADDDTLETTNDGTKFFIRNSFQVREDFNSISLMRGIRIQDIIENLILMSEYGEQFVTADSDDKGKKKYWRIETDVYTQANQENYTKRQRSAKIYVFKVLVYRVSEYHFNHTSTTTKGIESLKASIPKKYDYIYTGKNDDIINFDLTFNTSFYAGIARDQGTTRQDSVVRRDTESESVRTLGEGTQQTGEATVPLESVSTTTSPTGGSGSIEQSNLNNIARFYNDVILNSSADLIVVDLEIWGDPYYFSDSGIGNYTAKPDPEQPQTMANKTISYQNNEPYLLLNFATPIDYDQSDNTESYGEMMFPGTKNKPVRQFSGVYRIHTMTTTISQNKFTQILKLTRVRNQQGTAAGDSLTEEGSTDNLSLFAQSLYGWQASAQGGNE